MKRLWIAIIGILGTVALYFRGEAQAARAEKARQDADIAKASQDATERATEALVRGVANEQKPVKRGYFSDKSE